MDAFAVHQVDVAVPVAEPDAPGRLPIGSIRSLFNKARWPATVGPESILKMEQSGVPYHCPQSSVQIIGKYFPNPVERGGLGLREKVEAMVALPPDSSVTSP